MEYIFLFFGIGYFLAVLLGIILTPILFALVGILTAMSCVIKDINKRG